MVTDLNVRAYPRDLSDKRFFFCGKKHLGLWSGIIGRPVDKDKSVSSLAVRPFVVKVVNGMTWFVLWKALHEVVPIDAFGLLINNDFFAIVAEVECDESVGLLVPERLVFSKEAESTLTSKVMTADRFRRIALRRLSVSSVDKLESGRMTRL